jgi:hypothetical protein
VSDYITTTEEVRGAYEGQLIKVGDNAYQLLDEAHAKAEFDRWLAEVKAQVWEECSDAYILKITGHSTNGGFLRLDNPYRQGEEQ